jgi:hypothetical protein
MRQQFHDFFVSSIEYLLLCFSAESFPSVYILQDFGPQLERDIDGVLGVFEDKRVAYFKRMK